MKTFVFLLVLACAAFCQAASKNFGQLCQDGDTCQGDTMCFRTSPCRYGYCWCPEGQTKSSANKCKMLKKVNEKCTIESDCYDGGNSTTCSNTKCQCDAGMSASDDGKKCAIYVGDACTINANCNQGTFMECKSTKCACKGQFKEDHRMCRGYELGDDCKGGKTCSAGSCKDNVCKCANNRVAYLNYCIDQKATKDLGVGEVCTSFSTTGANGKFCGKGLNCDKCPNEGKRVCMGAASLKTGIMMVALSLLASLIRI